ncbi:hypothetical protein L873DRAFT_1785304 [Choiromyces venosus 120613-1]|uniref:ferric-chelate reductase (NADPH) n=1 Tax=Choiromyces venosus 120613-1 TaxID=1336337 RepID=A0A3N4KCU9_9PEZI|nr:hypothetical protein L873DRAFT_1785304 [Choiromyces venosus 120613-1]
MIPLFVCMARNNFVGHAVEVGFDIWNLFHRWIGRVVVLESVAHMLAWTVNKVDQAGWKGLDKALRISPFYQVGLMPNNMQAEIALILIAILSASPLRHANYEFFLSMHQLLVVFFVAGVWWHLHIDILPQMVYCNIAIAIWVADRVFRILRILRNNIRWRRKGLSCNIAEVTPLKGGDAVRFSVELYTSFGYKPGTHAYLYVPRIGWWQSHPFSIAWSSTEESTQMIEVTQIPDRWETRNSTLTIATVDAISRSQNRATTSVDHNAPKNPYDPSIYHSGINSVQVSVAAVSPGGTSMQQKMYNNLENYLRDNNPHGSLPTNPRNTIVRNSSVLPMRHRELVATSTPKKTTMHFIISKHNGFTKALYDAAQSATATTDPEKPENGCVLKVLGLVEGPYGGHHSFDSFGTVVLVAGGVGITHCLGYVRHLLHGYSEGTAATQKLKLVWVIRKSEYIDWVSDWLEEILRMPFCRQVLKIDIYITRPSDTTSGNGWAGRGGIVSVHVGRPEFETVIEKVVRHRVGAMAVTVCGGGAVSDSVRAATLKFIEQATIDFSEESFTW